MSEITLHLGDCLDILPTLPAQSVEAIITDLPYGTTACKWDEIIPFAPMWAAVKRILKPRGVFVTTASQPFTSALIMSNLEMFKYSLIWKKSKPSNFLNAKNKPMPIHEEVNVFSLGTTANLSENKMTYNPQMQTGTPYRKKHINDPRVGAWDAGNRKPYLGENINNGTRYPTSVIEYSNGNNFSVHPTQKPVALYEYLIRTYTNEGDTVLDFCAGSGTTGIAAMNTGRNAILIEKDAKYFEIIQRRIAEAQPCLTI